MVSDMSDTTDDLKIEIEDEAPATPEVVVEEAPKPQEGPTAEEALAELRAQLDGEKRRADAAEERARQEALRAHAAGNEVEDANLQIVNTAIEQVKTVGTNLKAQIAAAYRAQDYDAVAELQEAISINASRLTQLENGKQAMEAQPKREAPRAAPVDPVEALASQLSSRSAAWVRAHPDFARDPVKMQKMVAAHNLATADGIAPDTDEYFSAIETTLRIAPREDAADDPMSAAAKPTQRRAAPAAAPVSRSGAAPGARPNTIRLTRDEIEAAEISGMTPEQYARHKYALTKEGKMH